MVGTCGIDFRGVLRAVAAAGALTLTSCDYGDPPPPPVNLQQPASSETGFVESTGARLSYRLDLPPRTGRVPAVVIGHGSGRATKETCRYLSTGFLARGFATLCYDKRGVGESTGEYSSVGPRNSDRMFDLLGEDMAAGVRFLRSHDAVDGARVGLVGGSQAGWIIPVAAARVRPAFMILLVGPTVSVGEEIFYSDIVEKTTAPLDDGYKKLPTFTGERGFDPRPILETLDVPGLWLLGAEDRSIPTPETVAILDQLASQGRPFTRVVFPGVGHDLSGAPFWPEIDRWLARTQAPTLSLALVGNAAIHITDGKVMLVTDFPYRSGAFGYMEYAREQVWTGGNVVSLITHRHEDHVAIETLKTLNWRVVGPQEVTTQLPAGAIVAANAASTIDPALKIDALRTPHADVEHYSYVVEWHGRRFYFSGDTEDPSSALNQQGLDIAFVTPWMLKAIASNGRRLDAARVVIYHHQTGERVPLCTAPCELPAQGARWQVPGR
jgi:pimeloyl-ACP methyl ester carboxylesterase/L-ascorbate metabolism protein UlaG (beta-lactamase superfamily)